MTWIVSHGELEVLSPDVVQGLVSDVFQNPETGRPGLCHLSCDKMLTSGDSKLTRIVGLRLQMVQVNRFS